MAWRHNGSPRPAPKNVECKNPLEKFSPRFFGNNTASSSLIIFQRAKLSKRSITHLFLVQMKDILKTKCRGKFTKGVLFCTTMSRLTRHLQPTRNWPTWASIVLITHPILRIWPRRTTTCSLDWKNNWKFAIFLPTSRSLLPRRPGWTENLLNFFWVACKFRATG